MEGRRQFKIHTRALIQESHFSKFTLEHTQIHIYKDVYCNICSFSKHFIICPLCSTVPGAGNTVKNRQIRSYGVYILAEQTMIKQKHETRGSDKYHNKNKIEGSDGKWLGWGSGTLYLFRKGHGWTDAWIRQRSQLCEDQSKVL